MITDLGLGALVLAFAACVYAAAAAFYGARTRRDAWVASARNAALAVLPLVLLSSLAVVYGNLANDYSLEFSANVSSRATPLVLKITALWGGQNGSLLFWALLMAAYLFALMWTARDNRAVAQDAPDRRPALLPWVIVAMAVTQGFFLGLVLFLANPFARLWALPSGDIIGAVLQPAGARLFTAADGNGLNPLLRHPGMIIHPPLLYLGFTGMVVPYAFAIAALVTGRSDDAWVRQSRRWTLFAWLFLGAGLALGGRWAYDVLGWGGYWGWDPVENSSLLPWLTSTAFLHSVMIQEKRGMFKAWNMLLIVLTYALVILGTFITRTGIISSVHAFARSSIGPPFLGFVSFTLLISVGLMIWRWDRLRSQNQLESWLSRETAFLVGNVQFLLATFTVAWGTYFPMLSELLTGNKLTVGPTWFNTWVGPQFGLIVLMMGIGPLLAWRRTAPRALGRLAASPAAADAVMVGAVGIAAVQHTGALAGYFFSGFAGLVVVSEYARGARARARTTGQSLGAALWSLVGRNRRRYGGYIIHLGVVLVAIGAVSSTIFQQTTQGQLARGEALRIGGYTLVYENLEQRPVAAGDDKQTTVATVAVYDGATKLATLRPYRDLYFENGESMTPPDVYYARYGLVDVYVLLVGWETLGADAATLKVYINPLINLLWLGGIIFVLGTLVAVWPDRREETDWVAEWAPALGRL
jgi:cytochrome c-type biogenesis protein CcmF